MQVQQLRYFISLVDKHSFTEAAKECFVSQPALSLQVKTMEKELDVKLINRKGRSFEVTPAGKLLYERAIKILKDIEDLTDKVQRVNRNLGSTLRLGLLSSMDKDKLPEKLKEQVLNRTGLEVSLLYGSHDELYELFGNGCLNAFISDETRLSACESYSSIRLFSAKLYAELPRVADIPHRGVSKLKIDVKELKQLTLYTVCEPEHLIDEQLALRQMLHLDENVVIESVSSVNEGRKLILQNPNTALIVDRSLMRGDYSTHNKTFRYELLFENKAVKKPLCCFARKNLEHNELNELCSILSELGSKKGRAVKRDEAAEVLITPPPAPSKESMRSRGLSYTGRNIPL